MSVSAAARHIGGDVTVEVFRAPLFERILQAEESPERRVVIDLGGPCQRLIDRLSGSRPTRIEIAGLIASGEFRAMRELGPTEDAEAPDLRSYLPADNAEPANLILCWDLPNYLNLGTFAALCRLFGERAAPGCQLHMLIAYSKRTMPAAPARYSVREDDQIAQTLRRDDATVTAPRYSPEDLGKAVGKFAYERGILLANGIQEFVYAWPR